MVLLIIYPLQTCLMRQHETGYFCALVHIACIEFEWYNTDVGLFFL